jgi:undecaprenyldiphospho-muramoylpentapeptide beta-N-acetylglucosaminyltransferase
MATFCLVAGGGTAGHLLPGLAVADELVRRGHAAEDLAFVCSEREIDGQLLQPTAYRWTTLPGRGLQRKVSLENLATLWALARALARAFRLVRRERPRVVLAVGGYASVSCALAALVLRVPLVVAEQNARAGAANRLVARWARASAVPFAATDLPKAVVTGNPVRAEVLAIDRDRDRATARTSLGVGEERTLVLAFAGSLGATRVNDAVLGVARRWQHRTDLAIRHVLGRRDFGRLEPEVASLAAELAGRADGGLEYRAVEYESAMHLALAAADVAVCRAGGTTVAELAIVGLPAVLVPLPIATRDHQTANARELVEAGAAVLVPDAELDVDRLESLLAPMLDDPRRRASMAAAAASLGRPDAGARVTDLVEEHAR